ncbi:MAG TPA: thioesterase family protein [Candidatus Cloacimonas sp.]|nr:thioesterase family protein [Candidatus Cloacimonas sp.]
MIFAFNKRIYGYECDIYGHLNNANYLQLLEAARSEALYEMNLAQSDLQKKGIQLFVHYGEISFIKAIDHDEVITVKTCFTEINRIKGKWHQEIYNATKEICFTADITIVFASEGKAKRLPVEVFEQLLRYIETK